MTTNAHDVTATTGPEDLLVIDLGDTPLRDVDSLVFLCRTMVATGGTAPGAVSP
ncbi:MAG: hypothetical protein LH603_22405 [Pseudonocardia sp.]|nr:hypothetical protein [Pseudonocardia sp.]